MATFCLSLLFKAMWILPLCIILSVDAFMTKEIALEIGYAKPWMWIVTIGILGFAADIVLDLWKGQ